MSYIESLRVPVVFPTALRSAIPNGKFTSEENITGIIRAVSSRESFIKYWNESISNDDTSSVRAELIIHGYYFRLTKLPDISSNLYASIILDEVGRLRGWDDSNNVSTPALFSLDENIDGTLSFIGLKFSSDLPEVPEGFSVYSLQIYSDGNYLKENESQLDDTKILVTINGNQISLHDIIDQIISGDQPVGKASFINTSTDIGSSGWPVYVSKTSSSTGIITGISSVLPQYGGTGLSGTNTSAGSPYQFSNAVIISPSSSSSSAFQLVSTAFGVLQASSANAKPIFSSLPLAYLNTANSSANTSFISALKIPTIFYGSTFDSSVSAKTGDLFIVYLDN